MWLLKDRLKSTNNLLLSDWAISLPILFSSNIWIFEDINIYNNLFERPVSVNQY